MRNSTNRINLNCVLGCDILTSDLNKEIKHLISQTPYRVEWVKDKKQISYIRIGRQEGLVFIGTRSRIKSKQSFIDAKKFVYKNFIFGEIVRTFKNKEEAILGIKNLLNIQLKEKNVYQVAEMMRLDKKYADEVGIGGFHLSMESEEREKLQNQNLYNLMNILKCLRGN